MPSDYRMQIVTAPPVRVLATWEPGLVVEREFVDALTALIISKGVGFWRTEAHVRADVKAAINEYMFGLKKLV